MNSLEKKMPKLRIEDLQRIKEEQAPKFIKREERYRAKIIVHMGTCGISAGARAILAKLAEEISTKKLSDVIIATSGCIGKCEAEPIITVEIKDKPPVRYGNLDEQKVERILSNHVLEGKIVEEFIISENKKEQEEISGKKMA
jgi:(2Fe-2S) ferredoxin